MSVRSGFMFSGILAWGLASGLVQDAAAGAIHYAVQKRYALGGPGGWDYLTLDPQTHDLFIARADRVLVVSVGDGSLVATIPGTAGVHGIALAPALGQGFTSNGRADSVTVFDLRTFEPAATIDVQGHNPDAILYDPASKRLYTFNGRSEDVSVIDPQARRVIAKIPAGGTPEFAAADGVGRIYFNVEDKARLAVLDTSKNALLADWALPDCAGPTGLALDVEHRRAFSACGNGVLVVTDARSGRHVAAVPIGRGPDAAAFDRERGLVFSSNGRDGTLTVIHEDDADHFRVVDTVPTQPSARTMALDENSHRIYLVGARFGAAPAPTAEQPHPRPPLQGDSFTLLVVGD